MCRWLAYSGRPISLDRVLLRPEHSLIHQSLAARKAPVSTNGDGFGIGWYGQRENPGLYRDYRPAWNDENLRSLAEQIESPLFFAHVRASTGTTTSRANCHPFGHGRWLFMHNGQIGGYAQLRRELDFSLAPELYDARRGTTDSETLFLLALTFGLADDPVGALARTAGFVEERMAAAGISEPLRFTVALSDGRRIIAVRHSTDRHSPSLFFCMADHVRDAAGLNCIETGCNSVLVVSEPLDGRADNWTPVAESQVLVVEDGRVTLSPFVPQRTELARSDDRLAVS
jgi:predicted glutamine amidotransferase